jgi:uncharacterized protein (TIGR02145 family)
MNQIANGIIEKYCYNDNESNCTTYGGLYQWNEMMQYVINQGTKGICPDFWHLPSDAEWTTLTTFLGGENIAGGKIKETGTTHWSSPNTGATNSSGFTALGGGYCDGYTGAFDLLKSNAIFWSSSESSSAQTWSRELFYNNATFARHNDDKPHGFSVRCVMNATVQLPEVTTSPIIDITQTNATSGGNVISDGGATVTARGVCWSTSSNPTTTNSHTTDGSGTGGFTSYLTGLTPNTLYYLRAYAINSEGTSYGNQLTFSTLSSGFNCGDIVSYGGQNYNTVMIFSQCWFKENLNIGTRINGTQDQYNNSVLEKYCYNDQDGNCSMFGGLYQWGEMVQYLNGASNTTTWNPPPSGNVQGICPTGWHIPSDAEWSELVANIGGASLGGDLKSTDLAYWQSPNTGATDWYGFSALGGGYRHYGGNFSAQYMDGIFWSTLQSLVGGTYMAAYSRDLHYNNSNITVNNLRYKTYGVSVRCLKD